tara:strand:+ start:14303 stop:14515 length:213 start_codon:yes stop_codon:yes gene_type:complete
MPHRQPIFDFIRLSVGGTAGVVATFALVNQLLGTVIALLTLTFLIWRHLKDREYVKKRDEKIERKKHEKY